MLYTPDGDLVSSPLYTFAYDEDNPPPPLPEDGFAAAAGSSAAGSAAGSRPGRPRGGGGGEGGFDYGEGMLEVEEEEDLEVEEEEERSYPPVEPYEFAGYIGVKQASGGKKEKKLKFCGEIHRCPNLFRRLASPSGKYCTFSSFQGILYEKYCGFFFFRLFFCMDAYLIGLFSIACLNLEMLYCTLLSGSKLKKYGISFSSTFSSFVSKSIQEIFFPPSLLDRIFHSSACQTIWFN